MENYNPTTPAMQLKDLMKKYQAFDLDLQDAITQIADGRIQLPEFQRKFKWKKAEQQSLLESIQKNYPVGSLLLLEVSQDENHQTPFYMRTFQGVTATSQVPKYLVLDGQQRLTTCYMAFSNSGSSIPVIDLKSMYKAARNIVQPGKDSFMESIRWEKKATHVDGLLFTKNLLPFSFLTERTELRERLATYRNDLLANQETVDFGKYVDVELESSIDIFFNYQFPCVLLPSDLDLEAVANVFTKINTTGLRLSAFDLCVSTLFPKNIRLRAIWEDARNDSLVASLDEDGTVALQTLALLANVDSRKATLFQTITADFINRFWERAIEGMRLASQFLSDIGATNSKSIPYDALIPTLSAAMIEVGKPTSVPLAALRRSQLSRWVLQTAFTQRYTEGIDPKRALDFPLIVKYFKLGDVPEFLKESAVWHNSTMPTISNSGARFKAFLILLNRTHPRDFYDTNNTLGIDVANQGKAEIHHIFPRGYFKSKGLDASDADKAFNMTFLTRESNNFISDRAPSIYLQDLENHFLEKGVKPEAVEASLLDLLRDHFISADVLAAMRVDDFELFLSLRSNLVLQYLQNEFQIPFDQTQESTSQIDEGFEDSE